MQHHNERLRLGRGAAGRIWQLRRAGSACQLASMLDSAGSADPAAACTAVTPAITHHFASATRPGISCTSHPAASSSVAACLTCPVSCSTWRAGAPRVAAAAAGIPGPALHASQPGQQRAVQLWADNSRCLPAASSVWRSSLRRQEVASLLCHRPQSNFERGLSSGEGTPQAVSAACGASSSRWLHGRTAQDLPLPTCLNLHPAGRGWLGSDLASAGPQHKRQSRRNRLRRC